MNHVRFDIAIRSLMVQLFLLLMRADMFNGDDRLSDTGFLYNIYGNMHIINLQAIFYYELKMENNPYIIAAYS